jgi:hypothetical protein
MKHYVYRIDDPITGEFYIGSRSCKCKIEDDKYMGSYYTWKPENVDRLVKTILKFNFRKRETATKYEIKLIKENINNKLNRNYHIPSVGFHITGKTYKHTKETREKIKLKRKTQKMTENVLHMLRTMNLGKKFTKTHIKNISKSKKEFYKNNVVWNKGVKMPDWVCEKVSKSKIGKPLSNEHKKTLSNLANNRKRIKCTYCDTTGHKSIMTRWHFDNCKWKHNEKENN